MRKVNKMLMATVSILLCLVLISTSVVSGIYAKFVITKSGDATVSLKAFGITLEVKQGEDKPSDAIVTATPVDDNTISLRVDNIKMIPQSVGDYDKLIEFKVKPSITNGTPNVPKVKLKITVDFSGVSNFNIPKDTVLDSNYTITTGGNYIPFAFTAKIISSTYEILGCWQNPSDDESLETAFANAIVNRVNTFSLSNNQSNSIESIIWDSSTQTKFSDRTYAFGYEPYRNSFSSVSAAHPKSASEADAMYTYFANKTTAPTFSATYTVSIEQVID